MVSFAWIPDRVKSMAWYSICTHLSFVSLLLYVCYNCYDIVLRINMFLVIMFIIYFDCMLSIVRLLSCSCISSYRAHSLDPGMSGRHCVSVVLIHCLPVDTPYIMGYVVDRGCDTPIESFVVHSLNIGASRVWLRRKNKLCS